MKWSRLSNSESRVWEISGKVVHSPGSPGHRAKDLWDPPLRESAVVAPSWMIAQADGSRLGKLFDSLHADHRPSAIGFRILSL